MPFLNKQKSYMREAWEVMQSIDSDKVCPRHIHRSDILRYVSDSSLPDTPVPVVDTLKNQFFLGIVTVSHLLDLYNDERLWHLQDETDSPEDSPRPSSTSPTRGTLRSSFAGKEDPSIVIDLVEMNVMAARQPRLPHTTPLHDVIVFFSVHRCNRIFVTTGHGVVGMIELPDLQKFAVSGKL